jgi:hypothetical protein
MRDQSGSAARKHAVADQARCKIRVGERIDHPWLLDGPLVIVPIIEKRLAGDIINRCNNSPDDQYTTQY